MKTNSLFVALLIIAPICWWDVRENTTSLLGPQCNW